jgi:C-terminal processing protease CtpA/Prc
MLIRSLVSILILASSFVIVTGQTPDAQTDPAKDAKTSGSMATKKLRDIPFPAGADLQFVIKELARELDINVLFDIESFRGPRKTFIDLKNVTAAEALEYILLQEGLYFEEAGPKTILVATLAKQRSIPQIGVTVTPMRDQLAQYFGVDGGILIDSVRDNSPASKAGLKAGDVIVEFDGAPVKGAMGVVRAISDKNESDVVLTIVRDRKRMTIAVTPEKAGVGSIVQKP